MAVNTTQNLYSIVTCVDITLYFVTNVKVVAALSVIVIFCVFTSFFGTLANSLVILVYYRNPCLRTIQNTNFLFLAIADIGLTAFVQPAYVAAELYALLGTPVTNCVLWNIVIVSTSWFLGLSLLTVAILSLQSFVTLAYPYRAQTIITKRRLEMLVVCSWAFVSITTFASAMFKDAPIAKYVYMVVVTLTFCSVIFTWIWTCRLVSRHRRAIHSTQTPASNKFVKGKRILRSTITALVVTSSLLGCHFLALLLCLYPFIHRTPTDLDLYKILFTTSISLMYLNSFLNPCLLFWRNSSFRAEVKRIFS